MAINPDWLVKAEGNRNYHQGGMRYYFLIFMFYKLFFLKSRHHGRIC
ncbi:Uncharacterised protein [Klebsiella variicola]|uniref:Uncharacterized protein n=1 Tax=Klebsiella variicola TaxID=244366 RepID=A0A7H4MMG2_KLEVA|nr:Uncharacterised protein [Klebsiella variicola]